MEDNRGPAAQEAIDNLFANMKATMESVYHEMYAALILGTALQRGVLDTLGFEKRETIIYRQQSNSLTPS